ARRQRAPVPEREPVLVRGGDAALRRARRRAAPRRNLRVPCARGARRADRPARRPQGHRQDRRRMGAGDLLGAAPSARGGAPGAGLVNVALPALREELAIGDGPRLADGQPSWTLHDPVRNLFFRIDWQTFEILSRWDLGDAGAIVGRIAADTALHPSP